MDICHLKNAELEAKHQKYKGRVVLRGDIVKDDSGSARQKLTDPNFKPLTTEEVYWNWVKLLILSKKNFIALKQKNFNGEINNFFMNGYCSKIRNYVKPHQKSLTEMEELKKFQSSTFDTVARRRLVEDQDTILELSGKI